MLPIPLDIILTTLQQFCTILLAATAVNFRIDYKKLLVIAVLTAVFNVCLFTPYLNLWLRMILTMTASILLICIFTKFPLFFSVIVVFLAYTFNILFESIYLFFYFSSINTVTAAVSSDMFANSLGVIFQCTFCLIFILIMKQKNFQFLNFDSLIQNYAGKFKPIILLILLIQLVVLSFYFIIIGFVLYGAEVLQTAHMDQVLFLFSVLDIFFIALFLGILYLINLIDKNMIKNAISIFHGEYIAWHEHEVQVKHDAKEQLQQHTGAIKRYIQRKQYSEALFEVNQIDSMLKAQQLFNIQLPPLHNFLQNKIYLAHLAEIDFILEIEEDLSGLEAYIDDSLLDLLQELYQNAFEASLQAECSEVYSKFIQEEHDFVIIINNNGVVLPPTHQLHLFDPHYTSKKALIHGQGLFKVKKLIDYYNGSIDIRGYDGYTRVTVKLPLLKQDSEHPKKESILKYNGLRLLKRKEGVI